MASMLDRAIAAIADFNNPFYAEERQRDVANEASAFGFGVLVWTLLFGAGATCWFFPQHYMAATVLAVWVFLVAGLTSLYAWRLGVTFAARDRICRLPASAHVRAGRRLVGRRLGARPVRTHDRHLPAPRVLHRGLHPGTGGNDGHDRPTPATSAPIDPGSLPL